MERVGNENCKIVLFFYYPLRNALDIKQYIFKHCYIHFIYFNACSLLPRVNNLLCPDLLPKPFMFLGFIYTGQRHFPEIQVFGSKDFWLAGVHRRRANSCNPRHENSNILIHHTTVTLSFVHVYNKCS